MPAWLAVHWSKAVFFMTLYDSINDMKYLLNGSLHLSRVTAIFVVDGCQFGPIWIFGLKMEILACSGSIGGTTEQGFIFPDLI